MNQTTRLESSVSERVEIRFVTINREAKLV